MYIILNDKELKRLYKPAKLVDAKRAAIAQCTELKETQTVFRMVGKAQPSTAAWTQGELPLDDDMDQKQGRQDHESKVFPPYDDPKVIKTLPKGWTKEKPKEWQEIDRPKVTSATGKENG